MRSLLFILLIFGIIAIALYWKFGNPFSKKDSYRIAPVSEWESILIGKWKYTDEAENEQDYLKLDGDIKFNETREFEMHVTSNFYDLDHYSGLDDPTARSGGFISGKWEIAPDGFKLHIISNCDITPSINEQYYRNNESTHFDIKLCDYLKGCKYGNQDGSIKTEIKNFTKDSIVITGKKYNNNAIITVRFIKDGIAK